MSGLACKTSASSTNHQVVHDSEHTLFKHMLDHIEQNWSSSMALQSAQAVETRQRRVGLLIKHGSVLAQGFLGWLHCSD